MHACRSTLEDPTQVISASDAAKANPSSSGRRTRSGGGEAVAALTPDGYEQRLLKYAPIEVVTLYLTLQRTIEGYKATDLTDTYAAWFFAIFFAGAFITPVYLLLIGVRKLVQLGISTIVFVSWAFAIGGQPVTSFLTSNSIPGFIPVIILAVVTFLLPAFGKQGARAPQPNGSH